MKRKEFKLTEIKEMKEYIDILKEMDHMYNVTLIGKGLYFVVRDFGAE